MKKLLSLLISLSVILTCMSGITLVASADTTLAGSGTDADPYIIDTADKFVAVFGNGSTADLTAVYLLTGFDTTAMELPSTYTPDTTGTFSGKLLGGNLVDGVIAPVKQIINIGTIDNSSKPVHSSETSCTGAIFHCISGATISDLTLTGTWNINTNQAWNHYFSVLAGVAKTTTINRVDNRVNINVSATSHYAYSGIVGNLNASVMSDCDNYGTIKLTVTPSSSRGQYIGGIVAQLYKGSTIENCVNYADLVTNLYGGGIAGYVNTEKLNTNNIKNCINLGNIETIATDTTVRNIGAIVGGIANKTGSITISDSFNLGALKNATNTGLVCGLNNSSATLNISNFYDLANPDVTSVIGSNTGTLVVTNAYGYSETESTTENDVSKVSYETISALTETIDAFKDTTVWVKSGDYQYPNLVNNMYTHAFAGLGTSANPYRIYTVAELKNVEKYPSKAYIQMADITGMDSILCSETAFSGVYDGNGKSIELNITDAIDKSVISNENNLIFTALFAQTNGATLKNITTKGTVTGNFHGANNYTCTTALVGKTVNTTLTDCVNYADVTSTGYRVAGIVGLSGSSLSLTNCYNYGDVYGSGEAAGIVSQFAYAGKMTNCGNYGDITSYNASAGIVKYTQSANSLSGLFNVGTITATAADGVATGLLAAYNSAAKEISNSYNAGALIANTTYGIAYSSSTAAKDGWTVENCYNAVYADYPVAATNADALTITNCYYLADADTDNLDGTTAVTPANLISRTISDAFSIVNDYKYPQITANPLDTDYDNIDFYLVTVKNLSENETELSFNTGKEGSFYLPTGAELEIDAIVKDADFYEAYVNGSKVIDTVTYTINANTDISFTDKAIEAEKPTEITSEAYAFAGEEKVTVDNEEYSDYALAAAKAVKVPGLKRAEFGILFGKTSDSCTLEFAGEEGRISDDGSFGILICNEEGSDELKAGATYYFKPYVKYVDVNGGETTVYGDVTEFTYNEVE